MPEEPIVVLGFDFGMRCIGVAVGQSLTQTATPLPVLPAKDGIPDWDTIAGLIADWQPQHLIVGLPLNMDGSEQEISRLTRKFARRLESRYRLPVHLVDERLTTFSAQREQRSRHQKKAGRVDSIAAQLIVESWLRGNLC